MDPRDHQIEELQRTIAALSERIDKLERWAERPWSKPLPAPGSTLPARAELESRIGGHWLNRVGIVAVLVGVSYFLKYAFDNEWIGVAGRLSIGLLSGLGVIFWSEYVRRRGYEIYSHSLKAIGIGVLYLSLWASSQLYALVPNGIAFFAMTMVTAVTAGMAIWQSSEVLAAFAVLGGFITPVVLATGQNNAIGLFGYLMMLDLGILFISRYRPWPRILMESFVASLLLYAGWHDRFYSNDQLAIAAITVNVFFAIYLLAPFLIPKEADEDVLLVLIIGNAGVFFLEVYELISHAYDVQWAAMVAVALSGLYFLIATLLRKTSSRLNAPLHSAVAVCFLMVAIPIGLDGIWVTFSWLALAGILMFAGFWRKSRFLRWQSLILLGVIVAKVFVYDTAQLQRGYRIFSLIALGVLLLATSFFYQRATSARR